MELEEGSIIEKKDSISSSSCNPCHICLGPVTLESYLDTCFHKFCYNCIVRWTKVAASKHSRPQSSVKCPLCKRIFLSYMDMMDPLFEGIILIRILMIGTLFNVSRYWKLHKYLQSNHWLRGWLQREIQALIQEEDIDIVVHHILGVIDSWTRNEQKYSRSTPETKEEEFKAMVSQAAGPFLSGRTNRFVHELELFLASGLNIEAYDKVYIRHLGWKIPEISNEDEEEEGELQVQASLVPYLYLFDDDSDGND